MTWCAGIVRAGLVAAALIAACSVGVAVYAFTSTEGGYTVAFPAKPSESVEIEGNARTVVNTLTHDNVGYAVAHVDYDVDIKDDQEFDANLANIAKPFAASVKSRKRLKITRGPGDQLPAEEFVFEGDTVSGRGLTILDGRRAYTAAAFGFKPHDRLAAVDKFMKSFKLKPKPKAKPKDQPKATAAKPKL